MSQFRQVDLKEKALLCRILKHSRPMWLLSRLLNFDTVRDYHRLNDLWESINPDQGSLLMEFKMRQNWDQYVQVHAYIKEDDYSSEVAERQYFEQRSQVDLTVARRLTLVSQWPSRYGQSSTGLRSESATFVADKTLWKWVDCCLKELDDQLDGL